ncbi:Hemolysin-type calcium-binding repeat-containing protein [Cribrihabitans marinus]|uniref:Hemolysin-type calcium-binding repeat-containing protein n=1 Tax=Cribrihabitans marinus TaxID=1227549 RepID=A0A1H7D4M1_9RHOB|nr:CAP domain-containing protein [Cribrihabitans marinus]GGH36852.1 hypothetical protein GCM10010973_31030 [Cribrihabitans marinus]SEJ94080.1 Hemolysin-type calcium-binding repeat-containing protein [Cribrihabitans marinus]
MTQADSLERQMLDLINAERAARGLDPLQLELRLNDAAETHSEWMLAQDVFSHTGAGGSSAGGRMQQAGFDFSGSWGWAENIALQSERGAPGLADDVIDLHNSLMNSPGHRANILNPDMEVIGIGIEQGNFRGFDAVVVTQNFGRTSAPLQIDSGAGSAGSPGGGNSPSAPTNTATGGADTILLSNPAEVHGWAGNDSIAGSFGNDTLIGGGGDDSLSGGNGADEIRGGLGQDTGIGGSGNDQIWLNADADRGYGGAGDDVIRGGAGDDRLYGETGQDTLQGGGGQDLLVGGDGDDRLNGWRGNDTIHGESGNDTMSGGYGSDIFVFSEGNDRLADFNKFDPAEKIYMGYAEGIDNYSDLAANHMSQRGANVLISDDAGNSLLVVNATLQQLDETDFWF